MGHQNANPAAMMKSYTGAWGSVATAFRALLVYNHTTKGRHLLNVAVSDDGMPVADSAVMRRALEYAKAFDLVVIDEASQVHVPEAAVPIGLVGPKGRLVLAGDHRQHASINGALTSGRRAAEAVAARLCRDC